MLSKKRESSPLLTLIERLSQENQKSLQDYAEFLLSKQVDTEVEPTLQEPEPIAAAEDETVIQAIKRLSRSYYMLDKDKLLNETSVLVTEHTLQGRPREEVVADLEELFRQHYQRYQEKGQ
ncbi:MAG: Crp/Fnr family transcriptional regulator [Gammaproteobacteria bacterium]|nr:Crp/Fnr family transcriptional regulator [Gammaproteobacteria bacterium]